MAKQLVVRMLVPLPFPIFFKRFWPTEEQAAAVQHDSINLKLWLDADSLSDWHPQVATVEKLLNQNSHPTAGAVHIECELLQVSDELIAHVFEYPEAGFTGHPEFSEPRAPVHQEHELLGKEVFDKTRRLVNRFLAFARASTGQYCSVLLPPMNRLSFFIDAQSKISTDREQWTRWVPPPSHQILSVFGYHAVRNIDESNWTELCDFLDSDRKPEVVLDLLANADELAYRGYSRSAILEAVAALEFRIDQFKKSPKLSMLARVCETPVLADKFSPLRKKMGLRGTIEHLFPLYFTDQEMPPEVLRDCQKAVEIRQTVSHQGQRTIDAEKVKRYLNSIRDFCLILTKYVGQNSAS